MKKIIASLVLAAAVCASGAANAKTFEKMFPGQRPESREDHNFLRSLDYKQGTIRVEGADTVLKTGRGFYFLDAKDAQKVLSEGWGNPPDSATLGMIFPSDKTPFDYTWGAEVTFDPMGYVSDSDANAIDYKELAETMREDSAVQSAERKKAGYPGIAFLGFASTPRYDPAARKLHWAQRLHLEGDDFNTINYNIRALGRRGVLITTFIADEDLLPSINAAAPKVMAMTQFEAGSRYSDFNPSVDKVAAMGVAGLIAGKALGKTGFLLLLLPLLKKFGFLLIIPLLWLGRMAMAD